MLCFRLPEMNAANPPSQRKGYVQTSKTPPHVSLASGAVSIGRGRFSVGRKLADWVFGCNDLGATRASEPECLHPYEGWYEVVRGRFLARWRGPVSWSCCL